MSYVSPMGAYIQTDSSSGVMASVDETISMLQTFLESTNAQEEVNSFEDDEVEANVSDWSETSSGASDSALASAARNVAMSMGGSNPTGYCLGGVNQALRNAYGEEFGLWQASAYQTVPVLRSEPFTSKFKEVKVSREELPNLPAGSIVVWDQSPGHPHGHISIALGNGQEASDYVGSQMTTRDAEYYVFVPK